MTAGNVSALGVTFLVSAAHVLNVAEDQLLFYVEPGKLRKLVGGPLTTNRLGDGSDRVAVSVLPLIGGPLPPYPSVSKRAMPISKLLPHALPREGKHYLLIGYPATKTKARLDPREVTSEPVSFHNVSAPLSKYAELQVASETHIVVPFNRKRTLAFDGKIRVFPEPAGMSGAPIWMLDDTSNERAPIAIVGVATEHHRRKGALIATDVSFVVELIHAALDGR